MKYTSNSPEATIDFAAHYARGLAAGDVLALTGELGAGKTKFVQGLALGLDIPERAYVRSPTFTLMNDYSGGRVPLFHFDFYRLQKESDTEALGLEEFLGGEGIAVVEWADMFPGVLPANAIRIEFRILDEQTREIVIEEKR